MSQQSVVRVYLQSPVSKRVFEGWGTSLAWFSHVMGGAPDSIRSHYADMIFDANLGLGFNIVRYNIAGGENPRHSFLQPRASLPGYKSAPDAAYDWDADANQRWMLHAAKARGADIFEAISYSPPYWMTVSGSVSGSIDGQSNNLHPNYYDEFAEYLVTVVEHFRTHWAIDFRALNPLNEPLSVWWKFGGHQEGCHFDVAGQNRILRKVGELLKRRGLQTTVTASDENNVLEGIQAFESYDDVVKSYISKINVHTYTGGHEEALYRFASDAGKALWVSEYGDGDASGMTLAERIVRDIKDMKVSAWIYWQAADDSSGPGWGLLSTNLNHPTDYTYVKNKKYSVMKNFSRFVRPGYTLLEIEQPNAIAALDEKSGRLVIVCVHGDHPQIEAEFDLSHFHSASDVVRAFRTSADEDCQELSPIQLDSNRFVSTLIANSVTTFVTDSMVCG